MEKQIKSQVVAEQKIIVLLMGLVHSFRNKQKIKFEEIIRLFSQETNDPILGKERKIVWQVIEIIRNLNPQISPRLIFTRVISGVVGILIFNPWDPITDEELINLAKEQVKDLLMYSAIRNIDIPIACLAVDGPPFKLGNVEFHSISEIDYGNGWWDKVKLTYSGKADFEVVTFARVSSPGDEEIALDYAHKKIQETLLILRGIGFPITSEEINQFGILNEFLTWANLPIRLNQAEESIRLEGSSTIVTMIGPPIRIWRIYQDLLDEIDRDILVRMNQIISAEDNASTNQMEPKFIGGLRWLGEATKPDALPVRYLKLSTALEYLVGGEPDKDYLTTRGITATLAERAAFLLGTDKSDRMRVDREIRKYYGKRSKIIHGQEDIIDEKDFNDFGGLVRQIAFALSLNLSQLKTINDLQTWLLSMRYS